MRYFLSGKKGKKSQSHGRVAGFACAVPLISLLLLGTHTAFAQDEKHDAADEARKTSTTGEGGNAVDVEGLSKQAAAGPAVSEKKGEQENRSDAAGASAEKSKDDAANKIKELPGTSTSLDKPEMDQVPENSKKEGSEVGPVEKKAPSPAGTASKSEKSPQAAPGKEAAEPGEQDDDGAAASEKAPGVTEPKQVPDKAAAETQKAATDDKEKVQPETAETEKLDKAKAENEKAAKVKAEKEKAAKIKAEKEKEKEKAAKAKTEKDKIEKEKADKAKTEKDRIEKEKADKEKADKEKALKEAADKAKPIMGAGASTTPNAHGAGSLGEPASTKAVHAKKIIPLAGKNPTIIDLQAAEVRTSIEIRREAKTGRATLYNLNPQINVWYVLKIEWNAEKGGAEFYHIENVFPAETRLTLERGFDKGMVITRTGGAAPAEVKCPLWSEGVDYELRRARAQKTPYAPLCNNLLYVRNTIEGYRTTKEWVVEFLRDNVWGGETMTDLVKKTLFKDKYLLGSSSSTAGQGSSADGQKDSTLVPRDALIDAAYRSQMIETKELGVKIDGKRPSVLPVGKWHETAVGSGIFLSIMQAKFIEPKILASYGDYVSKLDAVESVATTYLIAFDLATVDLKFALGTEHPRLNWSTRTLQEEIVPGTKGPDGIDSAMPLVVTGLVNPADSKEVVATFTGGFKRSHSAFKWGELAKINYGSHYGFIENGVLFSTLNPYLATIAVDGSGRVSLRTWGVDDDYLVENIRFARQNGVPVIDYDKEHNVSKPGEFVSNWTRGNWSGSNDQKFRALRAGVCLQRHGDHSFLVYGYFSSVTPAAMARIFQAYQCEYAMHLDMNAPEHTYLAVYTDHSEKGGRIPEQLTTGMKVLDERFQGNVPRFIGYPDNRDFFYLIRKKQP